MPHGDVEQRHRKEEGYDEPPLHAVDLRFGGVHRALLAFASGTLFLVDHCIVAPILHRFDDGVFIHCGRVILHRHIVGQEVDVDLLYTGQFSHAFIHMGRTCRTGHAHDIELLTGHSFNSFTPHPRGVYFLQYIPSWGICQDPFGILLPLYTVCPPCIPGTPVIKWLYSACPGFGRRPSHFTRILKGGRLL